MVKILRRKQILEQLNISNTHFYELQKRGLFPRGFPLGSEHIRGWFAEDVDNFIRAQARGSRVPQDPADTVVQG